MDERDKAELLRLELRVPMPAGIFRIRVDLDTFVLASRLLLIPTITKDPEVYRGIAAIALLGGLVIKARPDADNRRIEHSDEEKQRVDDVINFFAQLIKQEQWEKPDDPVFSAIYHLLRDRIITRAEAVALATPRLESPKTAEQDAFRSRVNRWATARGLPPIQHTKRTSRKLNGRK